MQTTTQDSVSPSPPRRGSRRIAQGLLVLALALASLTALPRTAGAVPQQSCNWLALNEYVCVSRTGPTGWVDKLIATRAKSWSICDYHARFTITYQGRELFARNSAGHGGCMYAPRATRIIDVYRPFPRGSSVCTTWYEGLDHDTIAAACLRM